MFIGSVLLYSLFTLLHNDTPYYTHIHTVLSRVFFIFVSILGRFFQKKPILHPKEVIFGNNKPRYLALFHEKKHKKKFVEKFVYSIYKSKKI